MKKYFISLIIFILTVIITPVSQAEVLQGGVSYDVNSARNELMDGISYTIDSKYVNDFYYDKDYEQNANYILQGLTSLKDRTLAYFSDGTYAVCKNNDPYHVYYYGAAGNLNYVEEKDGLNYPYKTYKYNTAQKLVNMSMRVSKSETFIYSNNGKLLAHWLKDKAYDESGNVIMKRKYVE